MKSLQIIMGIGLSVLLLDCSKPISLEIGKADPAVTIDGERREWSGRFMVPDGKNFALGVSHSKNYIYVALTSLDQRFIRQIQMAGLTLWIDTQGKKKQSLAVRYRGEMENRKLGRSHATGNQGVGRTRQAQDFTDGGTSPGSARLNGDLDLIVLDKDKRERLGPADLLASARSDDLGIFIEMQVPLAMLGPGYSLGSPLSLGILSQFATPVSRSSDEGRGTMDSGMSSGGKMGGQRGGGRGGQGGGARGQSSGNSRDMDLELWVKISTRLP